MQPFEDILLNAIAAKESQKGLLDATAGVRTAATVALALLSNILVGDAAYF